nr:2-hydroxyacyl-CoA dehydratase family protein [Candidatus Sigynarchaeota archaeon]
MDKLAYFDSSHDFPEEIAMAAGFTPYKILGDVKTPNDPADQYLQNFICPAARSFMTDALAHSGEWAGIVLAHGCDTTHRFYDIWKLHVKTPFLHFLNVPMNYERKSAAKFFKTEMKLLITRLEAKFGVKITDAKLKDAIKTSNEIKGKLQKLAAMRGEKDITNREYLELCVKSVQLPKADLLALLDKKLKEWAARPAFPDGKKKILLTGSDVTYPEWMDTLEEANLRVVRDDLSIGERCFATLIPDKADPLDAIIEYKAAMPRPATKNPPDPRLDFLLKELKDSDITTVVSQNLKFCEPYAFDSVYTMKALKAKGYKAIHLEREFSPTIDRQAVNRLEAFMEIGEKA